MYDYIFFQIYAPIFYVYIVYLRYKCYLLLAYELKYYTFECHGLHNDAT